MFQASPHEHHLPPSPYPTLTSGYHILVFLGPVGLSVTSPGQNNEITTRYKMGRDPRAREQNGVHRVTQGPYLT